MAARSLRKGLRAGLLVAGLAMLAETPVRSQQAAAVDLALVLAVDCSFSVDAGEFQLQMEGLARAISDPAVVDAIRKGPRQRIAILMVQWSDNLTQKVVLPWFHIASEADAREAAGILAGLGRQLAEGGTSISAALEFSARQFDGGPIADRRVIDLSTDGRNNVGVPVFAIRNRVVNSKITINGLAIRNEWPTLEIYLDENVVGGPGHFVIPADNYEAYGEAIRKKLVREIEGPGSS
jgi:hypothetical protein